jgi:hypothetical protein
MTTLKVTLDAAKLIAEFADHEIDAAQVHTLDAIVLRELARGLASRTNPESSSARHHRQTND